MKKSTILLLFALTAAGFANAEDVTTSGNGVTYTLESLSTTENSGVTKNGKVYTLTNSITIAEGDRFEIESGATMKMGDGVPFNIASYALLLMMVAQVTGLEAGEFVHTLGDAHIYTNHFEQVEEQLKRDPRKLPTMRINPDVKSIFDFKYEDFTLEDYNPHPHIKGIVAV